MIYRGTAVEDLSHYATTDTYDFKDEKLKINNTYFYVVKAVFNNGIESKMSEVVRVNY